MTQKNQIERTKAKGKIFDDHRRLQTGYCLQKKSRTWPKNSIPNDCFNARRISRNSLLLFIYILYYIQYTHTHCVAMLVVFSRTFFSIILFIQECSTNVVVLNLFFFKFHFSIARKLNWLNFLGNQTDKKRIIRFNGNRLKT